MENKKIIGKCKCKTILSTEDIIEEGLVSFFDNDRHLSAMSNGKNKVRCPKCFKVTISKIAINQYKDKKEYLTEKEVKEYIESAKTHRRFFP